MTSEMTFLEALHSFRVLGPEGDKKELWDPDDPDLVESARKTFDDLKAKGYVAYKINRKGDKGEIMREFEPEAAAMIIVRPQQVGG